MILQIRSLQVCQKHFCVLSSSCCFYFFSAPEIYGKNTFIFDKNPNILLLAENLTAEAKGLLNVLKTTLSSAEILSQFQIELRKINVHDNQCITFKMSLRIDPVLWFQYHALNGSDVKNLQELYDLGSHYVEKVKRETEHHPKVLNELEIERIPIKCPTTEWCHIEQKGKTCNSKNDKQRPCLNKHYEWCFDEYRGITGECKATFQSAEHNKKFIHTLRIDKDNKPVYQCRHPVIKLNRQSTFCLFHANPNFWLYEDKVLKPSSYPYFIVVVRNDATPVLTLSPVKHCRNEDYVQTHDAWQAVLQTLIHMKDQLKLDQLPVNRMYINFGEWMSQKSGDLTRRDCHAHINIVLTRQTIEKINELHRTKDKRINVGRLFPSLVGSILPPKAHRLDDSLRLITYMNDHMTPLLIKQNRKLVRSISDLKIEVEKLKEENEYLRHLNFGPIHDAEEVDEVLQGTDVDDVGTGINEQVFEGEPCSTSDNQ
jgi:FtsZ-binding cell division protein ZapB